MCLLLPLLLSLLLAVIALTLVCGLLPLAILLLLVCSAAAAPVLLPGELHTAAHQPICWPNLSNGVAS
jgi:hypothetical protein